MTQSLVSFIILYHFENFQSCTATNFCPVMVSERPSIRTWLECWKNSFPPLLRLLRFFVAGIHGTTQLGCSRHQWLCLQGQTLWNEASWQLKRGRNGWKDMNNWTDHEKRWKRCLNLLENASVNWLKQVHAKYATTRTWLSRTRSEPKSLELMETFAWTKTFKHVLLPQLETGDV